MKPGSSARKRKKTRYLSLRRRLAAATSPSPMPSAASSPPSVHPLSPSHEDEDQRRHQLNLFPLQPEDLHEDHLSRFFPSDESISLHSLLGSAISANSSSSALYDDPISPSSSSANYSACSSSYGGGLAVAALRGREKWTAAEEDCDQPLSPASRRLSLKLDYDGILDAWKNQCPLYVEEEEAHQVVPDIRHTAGSLYYSPVIVDASRCGQWTVPDGGGEEKATDVREDREARVMRYKEKRLRRLYNKRIRYEVRKLNAEKRPRLKGRFIRRDDD